MKSAIIYNAVSITTLRGQLTKYALHINGMSLVKVRCRSQSSVFLKARTLRDVVRLAVSLGGDADTMACIAGSIAACIYPIPEWIGKKCVEVLPAQLLSESLHFEKFSSFARFLDRLPYIYGD